MVIVLGAIGTLAGYPWGAFPAGVALAASGGLCLLNAARSRRVHCTFTGPLFLGLGAMVVLNAAWPLVAWYLLWLLLAVGTFISFVPEMRGRRYWGAGRGE
ncbi:MAG: hypothetical protein HY558_05730 [Euryarchaeota archaeon]|nr:hypothetical protein [Euryarchaeota archaeon]